MGLVSGQCGGFGGAKEFEGTKQFLDGCVRDRLDKYLLSRGLFATLSEV